jgi:hypothetical protein
VQHFDANADGTQTLQKTDANGNVTPVITLPSNQGNCSPMGGAGGMGGAPTGMGGMGGAPTGTAGTGGAPTGMGGSQPCAPQEKLPAVSTIAVSPIGEVFLHFAQPFRYVDPAPSAQNGSPSGNPWSDGTYCQIFRVSGGTVADLQKTPPTAANLECMDNKHFINNWNGTRSSVFQFDAAGNVYYTGQLPDGPVQVVYKWDRATKNLTEMINANICVQDFLVTPLGGLFYTGTSSCGNGPNSGSPSGGFFRYVSNGGPLEQIAQNWWNFIFNPLSTAVSDEAVFYGPDPTIASVANWNSACLFVFDPTATPKTKPVITCDSNIWQWVNMTRPSDISQFGGGYNCLQNPSPTNCKDYANNRAGDIALLPNYVNEYARRCGSQQSFAGGGSQISSIKQTSSDIFVIGDVQIKAAGSLSCNIQIRGPHCKLNGTADSNYTAQTPCQNAGGIWVDDGSCSNFQYNSSSVNCLANGGTWNRNSDWYNNVAAQGSETSSYCTLSGSNEIASADWWDPVNGKQSVTGAGNNTTVFTVNNLNCQSPTGMAGGGDGWTTQYQGMAKVDRVGQQLNLLSSTSEQALRLWVIKKDNSGNYPTDQIYYSAYNVGTGQYTLNAYDGTNVTTMITNVEVYNLAKSGLPDGSLYFDGLDFADNAYKFGTVQTSAPFALTEKTGLTGTVKTMVYLNESTSQY